MGLDDERPEDIRTAIRDYLFSGFGLDPIEELVDDMVVRYERLSDVSDEHKRLMQATEDFRIRRLDSDPVFVASKVLLGIVSP